MGKYIPFNLFILFILTLVMAVLHLVYGLGFHNCKKLPNIHLFT